MVFQNLLRDEEDVLGKEGMKVLVCPASGKQGGITYRGPKGGWSNAINNRNVIYLACDEPGNHKDGICALKKDGSVVWLKKDTAEYKKALEDTSE
jgi:hypothetical protein